ncbi:DUF3237 domain-containing protein [Microbacterium azadirachtae]|uniref:DUF3237 domain-containing protein n=1 Tax=Microbacterium azadirachtae TaxID=582680 RepID=UPI00088A16F0|nr:DUF3237 domain-containing protein [Microbacterium azadirachtae]SDL63166.1 Protein of unknown function [Microbacterium azadirachtae]SEF92140.1 Protein of unknown function [Microbacterium azadirachtae]SEF94363.1 Protein of unknown function [Microbacterium azadirachtae]
MTDLFAELPQPALEPAFDVTVQVGPPIDLGVTSAGHRRVVPILGGRITGSLEAEILPGGSDRQLIREDGTFDIDADYSAVTADGPLLLRARGVRTGPPEVLARLGRGEPVPPSEYYFRTVVEFESSAPRHRGLQRALHVAVCRREGSAVHYRAYRLG